MISPKIPNRTKHNAFLRRPKRNNKTHRSSHPSPSTKIKRRKKKRKTKKKRDRKKNHTHTAPQHGNSVGESGARRTTEPPAYHFDNYLQSHRESIAPLWDYCLFARAEVRALATLADGSGQVDKWARYPAHFAM